MATSRFKWLIGLGAFMFLVASIGFRKPVHQAYEMTIMHPFYVSVTEIEYNAQAKSLEISCKMFSEDFEKALTQAFHTPIDIYHPKSVPLLEQQMAQYLRPQLSIRLDGKPLVLQMIGHELESQSTYCYFEVTGITGAPKKIDIVNKILQEMNNHQINIMHVTFGGNRKSIKLDYPASEATFQF